MAYELKNILINRIIDKEIKQLAQQYICGDLVDIGCGEKPYKQIVKPFVRNHVGVDHPDTLHKKTQIDRFGTAYKIPAQDGEFDSAICTAVLEHLEEPEIALMECNRILKKGGIAIYTAPFIWHLHEEPRDFYRYSKYGLRYLFEKSGFEIIEIRALSGFWVTFGQLLVYNIYRLLHRGILKKTGIIHILGFFIQGFSYLLDKIDRAEQWTWMYSVVARKKQ
jgi:SAM-dependent methyltransferase